MARCLCLVDELKILIADDQLLCVMLMKRALQKINANWKLTTSSTAEEVLDLWNAARATESPFNLLIIDENLTPDRNNAMLGSDAIKMIRQQENVNCLGNSLAVISCTSDADLISEKLIACGANCVWGKPPPENAVMKKDLQLVLENISG